MYFVFLSKPFFASRSTSAYDLREGSMSRFSFQQFGNHVRRFTSRSQSVPGVLRKRFGSSRTSLSLDKRSLRIEPLEERTMLSVSPDLYEPDSLFSQAKFIALDGSLQQHTIHELGDIDWCKFELLEESKVTIETNGTGGDTLLTLYASTDTENRIAYDDDSGNGRFSRLQTYLEPGEYYIAINEYGDNSTIENYSLAVTAEPLSQLKDAYEPDDSYTEATEISLGVDYTHNIHKPTDKDYSKFTISEDSRVVIETWGEEGGNTVLRLYSDSNLESAIYYDSTSGTGNYSKIECYIPAGAYYVSSEEAGNNACIGEYHLKVDAESYTLLGDDYESDDIWQDSNEIQPDGSNQEHSLHQPDDIDWYSFEITVSSQVSLQVLEVNVDTELTLFSGSATQIGEQLDHDRNGGENGCSQIDTWLSPGIYYASVSLGSGNSLPAYLFSVDATSLVELSDSYEPNDSYTTAVDITDGGIDAIPLSIHHPGDMDWFSFHLDEGSLVSLETSGASGDTFMSVYNSSDLETAVITDDYSGVGNFSKILDFFEAGTWYVMIEEDGKNIDIPEYFLSIDITSGSALLDSYEPDDGWNDASELALDGTSQSHNLHIYSDKDYYKFSLSESSRVTIDTAGINPDNDLRMYLYGAGNLNQYISSDSSTGWENYPRITVLDLAAGDYYVMVKENGENAIVDNYTISATATPVAALEDSYEPDNAWSEATQILPNTVSDHHSIHTLGDYDYYRFELSDLSLVTLQALVQNKGDSDGTAYLELYSASDLANPFKSSSVINQQMLPAGTWYVTVNESYNNATIDDYQLSLTVIETSERENNTPAQAVEVETNGLIYPSCTWSADDEDWFFFHLDNESDTVIQTIGESGDTFIELYRADDLTTPVSSDDYSGASSFSMIHQTLVAGDWYVRVYEYGKNSIIPSWSFSVLATSVTSGDDDSEPNNSFGQTTPMPIGEADRFRNLPLGDEDYFSFSLSQASLVTITTDGPEEGTKLELYNMADTSTVIASDNSSGRGYFSTFTTVLSPGDYAVVVKPDDSDTPVAAYSIRTIVEEIIEDDYEVPGDDTAATATILIPSVPSEEHTLHRTDDVDWFRFSIQEAGAININLDGTLVSDDGINMKLYSADDLSNALESRYSGNSPMSISYEASLPAGDYYVQVIPSYYADYIQAFYDIELQIEPLSDLTIRELTVSQSDLLLPGDSIDIHWIVENIGLSSTSVGKSSNPSWYDKVYLSIDDQFDPSEDEQILSIYNSFDWLVSGQQYKRQATIEIPDEEMYYGTNLTLFVCTDFNDNVVENDEANNVSSTTLELKPFIKLNGLAANDMFAVSEDLELSWLAYDISGAGTVRIGIDNDMDPENGCTWLVVDGATSIGADPVKQTVSLSGLEAKSTPYYIHPQIVNIDGTWASESIPVFVMDRVYDSGANVVDPIGGSSYEVYGIDAGITGGKIFFRVKTNYNAATSSGGDIHLTFGEQTYGIAVNSHTTSDEQVVFKGDLYSGATFKGGTVVGSVPTFIDTYETHITGMSSIEVRAVEGQEWRYEVFGQIEESALTSTGSGTDNSIDISWAMYCGNDTAEVEVPVQNDLIAGGIDWVDGQQAALEFHYSVSGGPLQSAANVSLYWASGTTFESIIGGEFYTSAVQTENGSYGPITVNVSDPPPEGATHVLLVMDPGGSLQESNEENNISSMSCLTDLVAKTISWKENDGDDQEENERVLQYTYTISEVILLQTAKGSLFWASGEERTNIIGDAIHAFSIEPAGIGDYGPTEFTLTEEILQNRPGEATHILLVVDVEDAVTEADEENNVFALAYDEKAAEPEYLARVIAYKDWTKGAAIGCGEYIVDKVIDGAGFYAIGLLKSVEEGQNQEPIMLFRGTDPSNVWDLAASVFTDVNPEGIGYDKFVGHKTEVEAWISQYTTAGQTVDLIGHSLGGAMCQWFAADITASRKQVGHVYTYNSPGIDDLFAARFLKSYSEGVTHSVVNGDIVSMAGEAFIDGTVNFYSYDNWNVIIKHSLPVEIKKYGEVGSELIRPSDITCETLTAEELSDPWFYYDDAEYICWLVAAQGLMLGAASQTSGSIGNFVEAHKYLPAKLFFRTTTEQVRQEFGNWVFKTLHVDPKTGSLKIDRIDLIPSWDLDLVDIEINYNSETTYLDMKGGLEFPSKGYSAPLTIGIEVGLQNHTITTIGGYAENINKLILPTLALYLQEIDAKLEHFANKEVDPLPTTFSGKIGVSFGPTYTLDIDDDFVISSIAGKSVKVAAVAASGGLEANKEHFKIDGDIFLISEWIMRGEGELELEWTNDFVTGNAQLEILAGVIDMNADIFLRKVSDVLTLTAHGAGVITLPDRIPRIGGIPIISGTGRFDYNNDGNWSNDKLHVEAVIPIPFHDDYYISADIFLDGKYDIKTGWQDYSPAPSTSETMKTARALGDSASGDTTMLFLEWEGEAPDASISLVMPDGTRISESDLDEWETMARVDALCTDTRKVFIMQYEPEFVDAWTIEATGISGEITKTLMIENEAPLFSLEDVALNSEGSLSIDYTLSDSDDSAGVRFYLADNPDGMYGVEISDWLSGSGGTYQVFLSDFANGQYYVYAEVADEFNMSTLVLSDTLLEIAIHPEASFNGQVNDQGVDDNGDGQFDRLVLDLGMDVHVAGNYKLTGMAFDSQGNYLCDISHEAFYQSGEQVISVGIDGKILVDNQADGPYKIRYLTLLDCETENVLAETETVTTSAYSYTDFAASAYPEIEVRFLDITLVDGDTSLLSTNGTDFGSVTIGNPAVSRTFRVYNRGSAALTATGLTVPSGYTITESLDASIAPGEYDDFTIQLNTATTGTFEGTVHFNNNDTDESPFDFAVSGIVTDEVILPTISVAGSSVMEGDSSTASLVFTVSLSAASNSDITVSYTTTDGTAAIADNDYIAATDVLTIPAGQTSGTITVAVKGDTVVENDETLTITLSNPTGATLATSTATGTIQNDDVDSPTSPEIEVKFNDTIILDGASSPLSTNGTDFGTVTIGGSAVSRTFRVYNTGNANLTTSGLTVPSGYTITESLDASIAPGGYDDFTIRFNTSAIGTFAGTLSLVTNDSDENPFDFAISGTVAGLSESNLSVTQVTNQLNGVAVDFSEWIDPDLSGNAVTLLGQKYGTVSGSVDVTGNRLTFTADCGVLPADIYTLVLGSSANGIVNAQTGVLLDGEYSGTLPSGDGTAGGDFVYTFEITNRMVLEGSTDTTGQAVYAMDFAKGSLIGFELKAAAGSTFSPESIMLTDSRGTTITPEFIGNAGGVLVALFNIPEGKHTLTIKGTPGDYTIEPYCPGDVNGDRIVDLTEKNRAAASASQATGEINQFLARYYQQRGIDVRVPQYHLLLDADRNGQTWSNDAAWVAMNENLEIIDFSMTDLLKQAAAEVQSTAVAKTANNETLVMSDSTESQTSGSESATSYITTSLTVDDQEIQCDLNGDNAVDLKDLLLLLSVFQYEVDKNAPAIACASDFDHSGTVDLADLLQMLAKFGYHGESASSSDSTASLCATDTVPTESSWDETDKAAIAKELAVASKQESSSVASDQVFALELDPYADL